MTGFLADSGGDREHADPGYAEVCPDEPWYKRRGGLPGCVPAGFYCIVASGSRRCGDCMSSKLSAGSTGSAAHMSSTICSMDSSG